MDFMGKREGIEESENSEGCVKKKKDWKELKSKRAKDGKAKLEDGAKIKRKKEVKEKERTVLFVNCSSC